jgi:hypothetical protein
VDDGLNAEKYIMPGLGDFGDRYFGTSEISGVTQVAAPPVPCERWDGARPPPPPKKWYIKAA